MIDAYYFLYSVVRDGMSVTALMVSSTFLLLGLYRICFIRYFKVQNIVILFFIHAHILSSIMLNNSGCNKIKSKFLLYF